MTIQELIQFKESENKVEFKEAKGGNFSYNGGSRIDPKERRRCILGYVTAFANEGGGYLVLGVSDKYPHQIVGTTQCLDTTGKLEQDIYNDTRIRTEVSTLNDDNGNRVLIIKINARPIGKLYKFEDVPLMRIGEELLPMSDEKYRSIIQEQEPDFSESICVELKMDDLEVRAIQKMKEAYARKQENPLFLTQSNSQCLTDLNLSVNGKLTNASLILLGKTESIKRYLPQSTVCLEFRNSVTQITFDSRQIVTEPYFLAIDTIWDAINLRNGKVPVQEGPYIFDIHFFNKEVIREALNNAVAHRDYRRSSEVLIKQFPQEIYFINPGGFPLGVTLQNLLTVNSTPRNRLLTDVLAKTGIVERSGQGIDKIYYQCISEAKPEPDYSKSDDYQVELRISGLVQDKAFALFIKSVQNELPDDKKLSVFEIIALNRVRRGVIKTTELPPEINKSLIEKGLIEQQGKTKGSKLILSRAYYEFTGEKGKYTKSTDLNDQQVFILILEHLSKFEKAKMNDFVDIFSGRLTRKQVRYIVDKLVGSKELKRDGVGKSTIYSVGENFLKTMTLLNKALDIGMKHLRENGELDHEK